MVMNKKKNWLLRKNYIQLFNVGYLFWFLGVVCTGTSETVTWQNSPRILTINPADWGDQARTPIGFFAYFKSIVGCLNFYDRMKAQNNYKGLEIILNKGPYLCPQLGANWWEYYFEPLLNPPHISSVSESFGAMTSFTFNKSFSRKQAYGIIQKYVRIKSHILKKVDSYVQENFDKDFIIGVHYRGTDKVLEIPRVSYQRMYVMLQKVIIQSRTRSYKIFVATDEQKFLEYLTSKFKNVIYTDSIRSNDNNPVHYAIKSQDLNQNSFRPYELGEEALIDCLLLSRCDYLIKTLQSHLSSTAGAFNPFIPLLSVGFNSVSLADENTDYNEK